MFKTLINKLKEIFCKEDDYEPRYEKLSDHPNYAGEETDENH